jgi:hypothetical protein
MILDKLRKVLAEAARPHTYKTKSGNEVTNAFVGSTERYVYDDQLCKQGFEQFDTDQDAHYYGVWVSIEHRAIVTYAEGDLSLVACASAELFKKEIEDLEKFHGKAPPMAVGIDTDTGVVTEFYSERVSAEDL